MVNNKLKGLDPMVTPIALIPRVELSDISKKKRKNFEKRNENKSDVSKRSFIVKQK